MEQVKYGVPVHYIENAPIEFKDFTLIFTGVQTTKAKVTVSIQRENFLVKDHSGNEQNLVITTVQLPPAPVKFEVGGQHFSLTNYHLPSGGRLGRQELAVFKESK